MHYKKLVVGETVIEFHNSSSGVETVVANGRVVSKKSSVWGTNHYFTIQEGGRAFRPMQIRYVLTSKVDSAMQVYVDLRRNGQLIEKNVPVYKGNNGLTRTRTSTPPPPPSRRRTVPRDNKEKKKGLLLLKEYELEKALESLKKAQKFDPKDADIYFHLACIYSVLEKTEEGFEALKNAKANGFSEDESILNHDMMAYLRINAAFEDFANSGFTKYDENIVKGKKENTGKFTAHSEYGKLKSVFVKKVSDAFIDDFTIDNNWKDLNYLGKPDLSTAITEYDHFVSLLEQQGTDIHYLPLDYNVGMDSMYCRDSAIATDGGMIICNMGKGQRTPEAAAAKEVYEAAKLKILGTIKAPGTLEGGDVAWLDEKTLAVGHGYRTNDEGFNQLKKLLEPIGVELIQVDLPHYKGTSDVFHLMSILSPVDKNLAVVYSPLMPVRFRNDLIARGFELVEVPDEEFESMGCNVLAIAPRVCLIVKGNPITKARLEAAGCTVYEYDGQEISVKGGGGPTCMTRPIQRER